MSCMSEESQLLITKKQDVNVRDQKSSALYKEPYIRSFYKILVTVGVVLVAFLCFAVGGLGIGTVQLFLTSLFSFLALIVVGYQALIAEKQRKAMVDALDKTDRALAQTQRLFEMTERPVLGIKEMQISVDHYAENDRFTIKTIINIKNVGRSVATNVQIQSSMMNRRATLTTETKCPDEVEAEAIPERSQGAITVQGEQKIRPLLRETVSREELQKIKSEQSFVFIWLLATYHGLGAPESGFRLEQYFRWRPTRSITSPAGTLIDFFEPCDCHCYAD